MLGREPGCEFSFSGLKTAVAQRVAALPARTDPARRGRRQYRGRSFQDGGRRRAGRSRDANALAMMPDAQFAGGRRRGVAANAAVRAALAEAAARRGVPMVAPPIRLCTDNAVMVAWAGLERLRLGLTDEPRRQAPARAGRSPSSPVAA